MITIIILLLLACSVYLNTKLYSLELQHYYRYEASLLSDKELDVEVERLFIELKKSHSIKIAKKYKAFCDEKEKRNNLNKTKAT